MSQTIQSGIVSNVLGLLDSIFKTVFQEMEDEGYKNSEERDIKNDNGDFIGFSFTTLTQQNHVLHIKALQSSGQSSLYDFYIVGDNNKKEKYLHQPKEKLLDCVAAFLDKNYEEADSVEEFEIAEDDQAARDVDIQDKFKAHASKKIQISLSKIEASDEICCGPIFCNYAEPEVYEDLEAVLDDDAFVQSLAEEPQNYEIIPTEDAFNVEIIQEIQPMDCTSQIIKAQFIVLFKLYAMFNSPQYLDEPNPYSYVDRIRWQLDFTLTSLQQSPIDVTSILAEVCSQDFPSISSVGDVIEEYCLVLDLYYPNYPHEIQKVFDEWLLTLRYGH